MKIESRLDSSCGIAEVLLDGERVVMASVSELRSDKRPLGYGHYNGLFSLIVAIYSKCRESNKKVFVYGRVGELSEGEWVEMSDARRVL